MGAYETNYIEARLWIFSRVINRYSRMKKIMAWVRLPEGVTKDQVDSDKPLKLYPCGVEAATQYVFQPRRRRSQRTSIFAVFDKAQLIEAVADNGRGELQVVGSLKTDQSFHSTDTV